MALAACRRSPGDRGRFGQLAMASGAETVIGLSQGGSAILFSGSMTSAADLLFVWDIRQLPCKGIRGVVTDAAPLLRERRDVGCVREIDGRPAQGPEDVNLLQAVDLLLGLYHRKDKGS